MYMYQVPPCADEGPVLELVVLEESLVHAKSVTPVVQPGGMPGDSKP